MSTSTSNTRITKEAADQKLVDGFEKHAQTVPSLVIGGTSFKAADITAVLQTRLATSATAQSTRATWLNAVKADGDERAKTKTFVDGVRQALLVAFAGSIDALDDFGLTPRKTPVVTPEAKAAAALKAKATRAARHTMGKKQKATIKGTVPTTAPATPPTASPPVAPGPVAGSPSQGTGGGTPHGA
jgi:acyl-coenzyme A thioesterase PaaI-like protein